MATRYMSREQGTVHFTARVEALRGIFDARATKIDGEIKALDKQRRELLNVSSAIECAERIAGQGLPGTAAAMIGNIASDAGAVCEFYAAESRILEALDAQGEPDDLMNAEDSAREAAHGEVTS